MMQCLNRQQRSLLLLPRRVNARSNGRLFCALSRQRETKDRNRMTMKSCRVDNNVPVSAMNKRRETTVVGRRPFSVSAAEVDKFNAMHADWWNPSKNPLISMNAIRVQYIRQQVAESLSFVATSNATTNAKTRRLQGLRALDIGCGGGLLSESLARLGAHVTGIDPSPDLVAAAKQHAQQTLLDNHHDTHLEYRNTTVEDLLKSSSLSPETKEEYDIVCLLEVIEHVKDPSSLLEAASLLLRPGGLLFVSTMSRTVKSHLLTIVGAEYILRLLPPGTHDWNLYRSPHEIRQLMESHGLAEVDTAGMVLKRLPFLSYDWTLDPNDMDVNWIGCYRKEEIAI